MESSFQLCFADFFVFLVMYNGQCHNLGFRVHGILKRKIPTFLYFLRMEKSKRNSVLPEFKFKRVANGYF